MQAETLRIEHDSMGDIELPGDALWGASTQRALTNLPISSRRMPAPLRKALARIKQAAASAGGRGGHLSAEVADAIARAAAHAADGAWDNHFPLDIFQTGSGTSTNMNMNEVLANVANRALGGVIGQYRPIHPNDHVNFGQSSNDVMPTALHLATLMETRDRLLPELRLLIDAWDRQATENGELLKTGRTHLQDALPVTFGHVFRAWALSLRQRAASLEELQAPLAALPLGGTAVGTGFQCPEGFAEAMVEELRRLTGAPLTLLEEPLTAMAGRGVMADFMGRLSALAMELSRIAEDVRRMASGPRLGYGEISIPDLQPGSSIMPGKVNPVVCESVVQVGLSVLGHHATTLAAAASGQFELNVALPVTAGAVLESLDILSNVMTAFRVSVVEGLVVNREAASRDLDRSLALATALIGHIGYARATEVAKAAHRDGVSVAVAAVASGVLSEAEAARLLDPAALARRGRLHP